MYIIYNHWMLMDFLGAILLNVSTNPPESHKSDCGSGRLFGSLRFYPFMIYSLLALQETQEL